MRLDELATMIGVRLDLQAYVTVGDKVRVTAGFSPHPGVLTNGGVLSTRGSGDTVAEAKADLCKEFAGKKIAFGWRDEPGYREFQVPETLEP